MLVQCVSGYTLSHHPAKCAMRTVPVRPKEPQGLTTAFTWVLVSIKFNMTFIYHMIATKIVSDFFGFAFDSGEIFRWEEVYF